MANSKKEKDIGEYLREMMGAFMDEEKQEAAKAGLKILKIEIPKEKAKVTGQ